MATRTTRHGLRKPSSDDFVSPEQDIGANMTIIDANICQTICTSTTRPGSPFAGQMCQETNTGDVILWDGTAWTVISSGLKQGKGFIATQTLSADSAAFTTTETSVGSITFTATTGRVYLIEVDTSHRATVTAPSYRIDYKFRWAAGASVTNADAEIRVGATSRDQNSTSAINRDQVAGLFELAYGVFPTGQVTVGIYAARSNGASTIQAANSVVNGLITVRDVGGV